MNILGDFITRVKNLYPDEIENEELNSLLTTIKNQSDELTKKDKEIKQLENMLAKLEAKQGTEPKAEKPAAKKAPAKKAPAKKAEPKAEPKAEAEVAPKAEKPAPKKAPAKKTTAKK